MPEVMFQGPDGRLEARYHHAKTTNPPLALVLHPHPLHGGNMNNRVVYTLYQVFQKLGFSVMRFNTRGVGKSQGRYSGGEGELSDAAEALDWLQRINPGSKTIWVAGYQYGAWLGMQLLMRRPEVGGFISVTPPANHFDFGFLAPCPQSGLIVTGGKDEIVPESAVAKLVAKLNAQKGIRIDYRVFEDCDHFFVNHCDRLAEAAEDHLLTALGRDERMKLAAD